MIDPAAAAFLGGDEGLIALYGALTDAMRGQLGEFDTDVQKTQISFRRGCLFACVSLWKLPRMPGLRMIVTFSLPCRLDSPRILRSVEPCPGRWTHHTAILCKGDIDPELLNWLREARSFGDFRSLRGKPTRKNTQ